MRNAVLTLSISLLFSTLAFGATKEAVQHEPSYAVFPFSVRSEVDAHEATILTDKFRELLQEHANVISLTTMTNSLSEIGNIPPDLPPHERRALLVDFAKVLKVSRLIDGEVIKSHERFLIALSVVDVKSGGAPIRIMREVTGPINNLNLQELKHGVDILMKAINSHDNSKPPATK